MKASVALAADEDGRKGLMAALASEVDGGESAR